MKQLFLAALCCGTLTSAYADCNEAATDTLSTFIKPDSVVFIHNPKSTELKVFGSADDPGYYYSYKGENAEYETTREGWGLNIPFIDNNGKRKSAKKHSTYDFEIGGVGFGFVNAINAPQKMDVNMASSYEIFWDIFRVRCKPWASPRSSFSIGVGIDWRNYRMTGMQRFIKDENNHIGFAGYEDGADVKFSRLKVFSLTVPLVFSQELGKGFAIRLGAITNFNTHASMKTKYNLDGKKITTNDDHIRQQKVTVDLIGQLNFKAVGLYVKYNPCNIIDPSYGPRFNSLSAGVTLFY